MQRRIRKKNKANDYIGSNCYAYLNVHGGNMLVLSRNVGEVLLIGTDVEITISEVRKQQVRLAISAPKHIKILRKELLGEDKSDSTSNPR